MVRHSMSSTDSRRSGPGSDTLLSTVRDSGPNYQTVLAFDAELEPDVAEQRFRTLQRQGLVERVSEEPCYRITALGKQVVGDGYQ